jgi:hypothetical protein
MLRRTASRYERVGNRLGSRLSFLQWLVILIEPVLGIEVTVQRMQPDPHGVLHQLGPPQIIRHERGVADAHPLTPDLVGVVREMELGALPQGVEVTIVARLLIHASQQHRPAIAADVTRVVLGLPHPGRAEFRGPRGCLGDRETENVAIDLPEVEGDSMETPFTRAKKLVEQVLAELAARHAALDEGPVDRIVAAVQTSRVLRLAADEHLAFFRDPFAQPARNANAFKPRLIGSAVVVGGRERPQRRTPPARAILWRLHGVVKPEHGLPAAPTAAVDRDRLGRIADIVITSPARAAIGSSPARACSSDPHANPTPAA